MGEIIKEIRGNALYVTISNAAQFNAVTVQMIHDMADAVTDAENDANVRVVVFRGEGVKSFCSGLSMEMLQNLKTTDDRIAVWEAGKALRDAVKASTKIVVSAVKGACVGLGFELSMIVDLIYCADNAKFALPEFNIGITPGCGGAINLHKKIPYNRFMEMLLFCDKMKADEALRVGLVNKVFPLDEFDAELDKVVEKLCSRPPLAVKAIKEQLHIQEKFGDDAAVLKESILARTLMDTNDHKNAVKAFLAKETPVFKGE